MEIDINIVQDDKRDRKKKESILSRRTMTVKYEVEHSEKKCRSSFQGSPYAYV